MDGKVRTGDGLIRGVLGGLLLLFLTKCMVLEPADVPSDNDNDMKHR